MVSRILGLLIFAFSNIANGSSQKDVEDDVDKVISVSMVELIIVPDKYLDRLVDVQGYAMFFDAWRIFLTCEHAHQFDRSSSIVLELKSPHPEAFKAEKGWTRVRGKIRQEKNGLYIIESEEVLSFYYGKSKNWRYGEKGEIAPVPKEDDPIPNLPTCHE